MFNLNNHSKEVFNVKSLLMEPEATRSQDQAGSWPKEEFSFLLTAPTIEKDIMAEFNSMMRSDFPWQPSTTDEPTIEDLIDLQASCAVHNEKYLGAQPISYTRRVDEVAVASEVGDDFIEFTNQPALAIMESVLAERLFGMVISKDDTFLSRKFGNFTEKFIMVPQDRMDLVGITTKVKGGSKTTPVIDIPPLRAILPVDPQVRSNVNSIEGKMTLFARSLAYSKGTPDELLNWKFSIFQDVLLGVGSNGDKFPYIPATLGGYDKPFPMGCVANIERAMKWWKRGRYKGLIATILTRTHNLVNGPTFERDPFVETVKSMYEGYQQSYVEYKRNMPLAKSKVPKEAARYMLGEFSSNNAANSALRRLRAARLVVSERDLIVASEVESYLRGLISSDPKDFHALKSEAEQDYRLRTTFSNSFNVLYNKYVTARIFESMDSATKNFAMRMDLDSTIKVKNFLFGERFYDREALDAIQMSGVTKVEFPLLVRGKRIFREENVGIETPDELLEPLRELLDWARGNRASLPPRELLEDDDIIREGIRTMVERGMNEGGIVQSAILVTSDLALCREVNEEMGIVVFQLPPYLVKALEVGLVPTGGKRFANIDECFTHYVDKARQMYPTVMVPSLLRIEDVTVVDLGSWRAEMEKLNIFPYQKPKFSSDRRREYFEYRAEPTMDMRSFYSSQHEYWPSRKNIFDLEGLVSQKGQGNPMTASLRSMSSKSKGVWNKGPFQPLKRGLLAAKHATAVQIRQIMGKEPDLSKSVVPKESLGRLPRSDAT